MSTTEDDDGLDSFVRAIRDLGGVFERMTSLLKTHRARWAAMRDSRPKLDVPAPVSVPERKPGDTWKVRVGAQVFDSVADKHGVYRFRCNAVIADLLEAATHGQKMDMNAIVVRMHRGLYSVEDVRELDALIGYSHSGFLELSYNSYPEESDLGVEPVDIEEI